MGLEMDYIPGQTPLEEEEKEELLIRGLSTRGELDEFEQQNIEQAIQWIMQHTFSIELIMTESFVRNIHRRMYGNVWAWAGEFRKSNKNLGVDKFQVPSALKILMDDTLYWIANNTFPPDEISIRFKHRLVSIHCFPNGNGRHSRLMADIIVEKIFNRPVFSWGASNLVKKGDARTIYLRAIWAADAGDYAPLMRFARS